MLEGCFGMLSLLVPYHIIMTESLSKGYPWWLLVIPMDVESQRAEHPLWWVDEGSSQITRQEDIELVNAGLCEEVTSNSIN